MDDAIREKKVILGPYYPFLQFRVAAIEVEDSAIELIETSLSESLSAHITVPPHRYSFSSYGHTRLHRSHAPVSTKLNGSPSP